MIHHLSEKFCASSNDLDEDRNHLSVNVSPGFIHSTSFLVFPYQFIHLYAFHLYVSSFGKDFSIILEIIPSASPIFSHLRNAVFIDAK